MKQFNPLAMLLFFQGTTVTAFFVNSGTRRARAASTPRCLFDNFFGGGKDNDKDTDFDLPLTEESLNRLAAAENGRQEEEEDPEWNVGDLRAEIDRRNQQSMSPQESSASVAVSDDNDGEFDGYAFRDVLVDKWGECFDVEFQPVRTLGFRELYLNVMPFCLGKSRRFRHSSEYDYLCHLQAVAEILVKYDQLDGVLAQIAETNKKPRAGTSPLVSVPLRLELSPDQLDEIMGN